MLKLGLIAYAILVALWNFVGVYNISNDQPALGPTASLPAALLMVVVAVVLIFLTQEEKWQIGVKLALSVLIALMGGFAVYVTLGRDIAQWPDPFWYYAGLVLNGFGAIVGLANVMRYTNALKAKASI